MCCLRCSHQPWKPPETSTLSGFQAFLGPIPQQVYKFYLLVSITFVAPILSVYGANGCAVDPSGQPYRLVGVQRCCWESHFQIIPRSRPLYYLHAVKKRHGLIPLPLFSCLYLLWLFAKVRLMIYSESHRNGRTMLLYGQCNQDG